MVPEGLGRFLDVESGISSVKHYCALPDARLSYSGKE